MKKKLLMALLVGVLAVPSQVSCFAAESTDAAAADSDEEEETEEETEHDPKNSQKQNPNTESETETSTKENDQNHAFEDSGKAEESKLQGTEN